MKTIETRRVLIRSSVFTADDQFHTTTGPDILATARRRGFRHWAWVIYPDGRFGEQIATGEAKSKAGAFLSATAAAHGWASKAKARKAVRQ